VSAFYLWIFDEWWRKRASNGGKMHNKTSREKLSFMLLFEQFFCATPPDITSCLYEGWTTTTVISHSWDERFLCFPDRVRVGWEITICESPAALAADGSEGMSNALFDVRENAGATVEPECMETEENG
jgi:hypothetical protein